jgi:serine/threonine-protein kinase RsbW
MLKFGINDCGILVATSPNSWKFKGISDDTTQRISTVLSFKYMTPPRKQTLFVPEHHQEMIEKLYRNIGADNEFVVIKNQEIIFAEPCAVIESELNELESCAEITVLKYGQDAFRQVRILLKNFCVQQVAAIQLFIRLDDQLTCQMTAEFEKLGFFFAGILPESRMGDVLILQYLNNVEFDYDKMHILTDLAKELSAYIKANDPNIIK